MAEQRIGRQTPTQSVVLTYSETKGQEAIKLYNSTKRTAQEWQELMLYDIMAVGEDGLWTHSKFGYSLPRRNGKNEIAAMREMYGLLHGEKIMHTAHRTSTSHSAWERLCDLLSASGLREGDDYRTLKQFGFESIRMSDGGGTISFRTRSSKGGLGEGFDLLVIDEAQEYTEDQETALKYVVSDSPNPQTLMCGTAPTPISSGTVFSGYREKVLSGHSEYCGWAEWSVDHMSDPEDRELWYKTNPSMGTILTERKVAAEIGNDKVDFNIQRLGLWLKYNLKSEISKTEWTSLKCGKLPTLNKTLFCGVKFGADGINAALSVAVKTKDGRIFIETLDCQPKRAGFGWIIDYLARMKPQKTVIDGKGDQNILADMMKEYRIKGAVLPTVKEVITANSVFEQGIFSKTVCHMNQPALAQAATNCEKRAIGDKGGFGYRSQKEEIEIALLESAILAFWACSESREKKKQRVSY